MSKVFLLVCVVVIVVVIMYARARERGRERAPSRALSKSIDSSETRSAIASTPLDTSIPGRALAGLFANTTMSSDDLFTIATANMRIMEDMRDLADNACATSKEIGPIRTRYIIARERARAAMSRAITTRAGEDRVRQHDITDDVIVDRAREFNQHVGAPLVIVAPIIDQQIESRKQVLQKWSSDPENVHDSLVGGEVARKISAMLADDRHMTNEHNLFGVVLEMINGYSDEHVDVNALEKRRADARHTLHIASANAHCSRYNICEFEALRLVYERSMREGISANSRDALREALVIALAECSPDGSSVCLVGRITRYVGSLDVVDSTIGSAPIMNVDAHRATLFAKLGQMQAEGKGANDMREYINQYFASDPILSDPTNVSAQKIKNDALAGVDD